ncbi:hypothetical protein L9F63_005510, partial [Diploptera punctata]
TKSPTTAAALGRKVIATVLKLQITTVSLMSVSIVVICNFSTVDSAPYQRLAGRIRVTLAEGPPILTQSKASGER